MNPAIDKSCDVDYIVADRKLRCSAPSHEAGGGGVNVSRVIKRFGGDSLAVFPSGGPTGELLENLLDAEGVSYDPVKIEGWTRENLMVLERSTRRQYRFGMPGPELDDTECRACIDQIISADPPPAYIVASGSLSPGVPDDFFARLAGVASKVGVKVIVDTPGQPLILAARQGVYLLKPNLEELEQLAGFELKDESHIDKAARKLIEGRHSEIVVVSQGGGGALLVTADGATQFNAPAVPVKSKIGAGDSMVAGIVHCLADGWELGEAVRFGVAAGAAAVMTPGTELARKDDTVRLYERMKSGKV